MEPHAPIQPDEILLRRVPEAQMDDGDPRRPFAEAFGPHPRNDTGGLSLYRAVFHAPEQAASFRTKSNSRAWVVRMKASDICALGLTITPDPLEATAELPAQPGHALIPELNTSDRKSPEVDDWKQRLLATVIGVDGPFDPPTRPASTPVDHA